MRNKLRWWLIKVANWIGNPNPCTEGYYDFGEPIKQTFSYGKWIVVSTERSIYYYNNKKWHKLGSLELTKEQLI